MSADNARVLSEFIGYCVSLVAGARELDDAGRLGLFEEFQDKWAAEVSSFLFDEYESHRRTLLIRQVNGLNGSCVEIDAISGAEAQSTLLVLKNRRSFDYEVPVRSQFSAMWLSDVATMESLTNLMDDGLPTVIDLMMQQESLSSSSDSLRITKSKLKSVSRSLQNSQETICAPDIVALVHPKIRDLVMEGKDFQDSESRLLRDPNFLNELQETANRWLKMSKSFCETEWDVRSGSAYDEIHHWSDLHKALKFLVQQLESPEVQMTISILVESKRWSSVSGLIADSGVIGRLQTVIEYNEFFSSIPMKDMASAENLDDVMGVTELLGSALKKFRFTSFPEQRFALFVGKISQEVQIKLLEVSPNLFTATDTEFETCKALLSKGLIKLDDIIQENKIQLREVVRRRGLSFSTAIDIKPTTENLLDSITHLSDFRDRHTALRSSLEKICYDGYLQDLKILLEPIETLRNVSIWSWRREEALYNQKLSILEDKLIDLWTTALNRGGNSEELLIQYSTFAPLTSSHIKLRSAMRDCQEGLLSIVKDEVTALTSKVKEMQKARETLLLKGFTPITAHLTQCNQIRDRVVVIKRRSGTLLGDNWEKLPEGRALSLIYAEIMEETNCEAVFTSWKEKAMQLNSNNLDAPMIKVLSTHKDNYDLTVNFDFISGSISKEVRNLCYMGYNIPGDVIRTALKFGATQCSAAVILEQLQTFLSVLKGLDNRLYTSTLLRRGIEGVWRLIEKATVSAWTDNSDQHWGNRVNPISPGIQDLEIAINSVLKKFETLEESETSLMRVFNALSSKPYHIQHFSDAIECIQSIIMRLSMFQYYELEELISFLNGRIKELLLVKTRDELEGMHIGRRTLSIGVKGTSLWFSPDLNEAKSSWVEKVERIVSEAAERPQLSSKRNSLHTKKFSSLAKCLSVTVAGVFNNLEKVYASVEILFEQWKICEALWMLKVSDLHQLIGADIKVCYQLLQGLIDMRGFLEGPKERSEFGHVLQFKFESSLLQIFRKMDYWQKFLCEILLELYLKDATTLVSELNRDFEALENSDPTNPSFENVSSMLVTFNSMETCYNERSELIEFLSLCEPIFLQSNFQLPQNYLYIDQLENSMRITSDCLKCKKLSVEANRDLILTTLEGTLADTYHQSREITHDWRMRRPSINVMHPDKALIVLSAFESSFRTIETKHELLNLCSKTIEHPLMIQNFLKEDLNEVQELMKSCRRLKDISDSVDALLQKEWISVNIDDVSREVAIFVVTMEGLSANFHNFKVLDELQAKAQGLLHCIELLRDLKSNSIKPKHWKLIFAECRMIPPAPMVELLTFSLRDIAALDLKAKEKFVKEIIYNARRESSLESSLRKMINFWKDAQYATFKHPSGMLLVRDWSFIQQSCSDDLDELMSMRNSACFEYFQQECTELESKLTGLLAMQLDWMEAQIYWLELFGVLGEGGEISVMLPQEAGQFHGVTSNLRVISSRGFQMHSIIELVSLSESHEAFKEILNQLKTIKNSLNDFLEQQRRNYPRFFLLGNSDLLSLLGAGGDLTQVSRYMRKMFGSISSLRFDDCAIIGLCSVEGEVFKLETPVITDRFAMPDKWISMLDFEIKRTISSGVRFCLKKLAEGLDFLDFLNYHSFQVLLLAWQITWTRGIDRCIQFGGFSNMRRNIKRQLEYLLNILKSCEDGHEKQKVRSLIVECIHAAAIVTKLHNTSNANQAKLIWDRTQKFYYQEEEPDMLRRVVVVQCGRRLTYGFAYIGVPERLIYTTTLEDSFAALGEALSRKYGGCLFGPAGTGKTETIKALAQNMGRMVLVFNCDDSFDFQVMARLLLGIVQVGAWGCFDELNRMNRSTLSSVTGPLEKIQVALLQDCERVKISGQSIPLNPDTGLFVTLNPGYEGRSALPENLKKKFRDYSMKKAEKKAISEAILQVMGFQRAKELSERLTVFFGSLQTECSIQKHYDFGLRSFKKVLRTCGRLINLDETNDDQDYEESVLIESMSQIVLPSLNQGDKEVYKSRFCSLFSHQKMTRLVDEFTEMVIETCKEDHLAPSREFVDKCKQLFNIQKSQQATILMGGTGYGKTAVWQTTLKASRKLDGVKNIVYVIDTKTLTKDSLYGYLNKATLEWKDGVFTSILRKVNDDQIGAFENTMVWIVLDSDLDPEYIEALNSALDDNKILTLPTGERVTVPDKIRLLFETPNLDHATPATITRCAIIWFPEPLCSEQVILETLLAKSLQVDAGVKFSSDFSRQMQLMLKKVLHPGQFACILAESKLVSHILAFDVSRTAVSVAQMVAYSINSTHHLLLTVPDKRRYLFLLLKFYQIIVNAVTADINSNDRKQIGDHIKGIFKIHNSELMRSFDPESFSIGQGALEPTPNCNRIEPLYLQPRDVIKPDLFVPTLDSLRQETYIYDLLSAAQPVILCGPPGSGKTTILTNAIQRLKDYKLVSINFSKDTSISNIFEVLKRHMIYADGPKGLTFRPKETDKNVVLFCDEINLPKLDKYGSQSLILFLRLLIEKKGFWNPDDNRWVSVERFRIVGACNPPSDPGRVPLSPRFLRHTSIVLIDHPSEQSLATIYRTIFEATFRLVPHLRNHVGAFCEATLYFYHQCRKNFKTSMQAHYSFSPRELTRWIRGIHAALSNGLRQTFNSVLRIWAYEAWRIFADRLVNEADTHKYCSLWADTSKKFFPDHENLPVKASSLLFSSWLSQSYEQVEQADLLAFVEQRLKSFCDKQFGPPIILHDEMLNQILGIDRVLKQPQGHAMLIGARRTGKTTMVKFVSWINGMTVLQPNTHKNYSASEFDAFLRKALLRCTVNEEKVCLIIDESDILEASFIERMNTLLANSDIPDLFRDDQYEALINSLRQKVNSLGLMMDSEQELYNWFIEQTCNNLHVIFTISNPCGSDKTNFISSPALFNRCVLNWMGSWSASVLRQISNEIIQSTSLQSSNMASSINDSPNSCSSTEEFPDSIVSAFLQFHNDFYLKRTDVQSPGVLLDSLQLFKRLHKEKLVKLNESRLFYSNGTAKLNESVVRFQEMSQILAANGAELKNKELEAMKTLEKMVKEQNEAERKQEATLDIKAILTQRESEAFQRREVVRLELEAFEPIMLQAQSGVKNIKKQQLTEIRSMINPPMTVKITIEAVCSVLGYRSSSWRNIQQFIRSDEFIYDIVHFDTDTMLSKELKETIENEFMSMSHFTYEKVHRASKACGPLYQWVYAQMKYSEVLEKIEPLRDEAKRLEEDALLAKARLLAAEEMISELEQSIKYLKDSYSVMIRDIEVIKSKMEEVQTKLRRAKGLVHDLSSEKIRWEKNIQNYHQSLSEVNGDCLISAIYYSYCGVLNEKERLIAFETIRKILDGYSIRYDFNYDFVHQNVDLETQAQWVTHGLPNENFHVENFLIAIETNSIPYVLDPSSRMTEIFKKYFEGKLEVISFCDINFLKKFTNAVKFGGTLLLQNAETYDPVINNVVSGVFQRSHGHRMTQIGDQEVDVSTDFRMFLYSNDAEAPVPDFLQSRVRIVNFSLNKASIEMQAVRMALICDAPEIEQKHEELLKLNGVYKILLETLERQLLEELSHSKGNLLENGELIKTLQKVKSEVIQIEGKILATDNSMEEIESFANSYSSFGLHCSLIYSLLKKISHLHWFYQLPLWLFYDCLKGVLAPMRGADLSVEARVILLSQALYQQVYATFSAYVAKDHKIVLAAMFYLMYHFNGDLKSINEILESILGTLESEGMSKHKLDKLQVYPEGLKKMINHLNERAYIPAIEELVSEFPEEETIEDIAMSNTKNSILVATEKESDSSFKILQLASKQNCKLSVVALGSSENEQSAEREIARSYTEGGWVLLQNIQMSMAWVKSFLTEKIGEEPQSTGSSEKDVKIFMTCDLMGEILPLSILQNSYKKVFRTTPSILGSVRDLWSSTTVGCETERESAYFAQLRFLLTWFHAILDARSRLVPIGFTKNYDFNECDFESGLNNLKNFVSNADSKNPLLFYDGLQFTLGRIIYGGKVDVDEDLAVVQEFCSKVFSLEAIESLQDARKSYELLPGVWIPQGAKDEEFLSSILNQLSEPIDSFGLWLGIPDGAIQQYERIKVKEILLQTQDLLS